MQSVLKIPDLIKVANNGSEERDRDRTFFIKNPNNIDASKTNFLIN